MLEPRIETIFCDDIREEVGNKRSIMGVYHSEMFVQNIPITLPRLCLYITFLTDVNADKEKLEITVVRGKEEEALISTGPIDLPEIEINQDNLGVPYQNRSLVLAFALSPFSIENETVLRVLAQIGAKKVYGPCLRIRSAEHYTSTEKAKPKLKL